MRRPETIWVGAMPFKVYFDHVKLAVTTADDGQPAAVGATNADRLEIIVDDRLPMPRQRDVLMHEVLHAVFAFTALRNVGGEYTEELIVDVCATQLVQLFRINPDFVEYMLSGSESDNEEVAAALVVIREHLGEGEESSDEEGESRAHLEGFGPGRGPCA